MNLKRWIAEIIVLTTVFAGIAYAAHETKFSGLQITDLTASRVVATDASKNLVSEDLASGTGVLVRAADAAFTGFPTTPASPPDADYEVANKKYVDDKAAISIEMIAVLGTL